MTFELDEINRQARTDPAAFIAQCDAVYWQNVKNAAAYIDKNAENAPIVLLSGPSGSGKTTTAHNIEKALGRMGVNTHTVSMDDYYKDVDLSTHPRGADGEIDFESPEILDIPLLKKHFVELAAGREVLIPKFDFATQKRDASCACPLRLKKHEVVIFEGIHALNDMITDQIGPAATLVYISARSNITRDGQTVFKGTWVRLVRRLIRDLKFRNAPAEFTLRLWENVRLGEKCYISPYKHKGNIIFNSSLPYELPVMKKYALSAFYDVPRCARHDELTQVAPALELFEEIDETCVPADSLIREFIGPKA